VIEIKRVSGGIWTDEVSLAMQGMNIYMAVTADREGNKSLCLRVGGVGDAVLITDSPTGNWTISRVAESSRGAGVSSWEGASICAGAARNVTEKGT
jgi:hypothetical protein